MKTYISGIGTRLGSKKLSVDELADKLGDGKNLNKTIRRCGTSELYGLSEDETIEGLYKESAQIAIENSGMDLGNIRGIYASNGAPTHEFLMPDLSRRIMDLLGISGINPTDVGSGCVGGLDSLIQARNQLVYDSFKGRESAYLVFSGDNSSRVGVRNDKSTAFLFSEGAACFLVTNMKINNGYEIKEIGSVSLDGDAGCMKILNPLVGKEGYDGVFRMDGNAVAYFAIKQAISAMPKLVGMSEFPKDFYFIPHQASRYILETVQEQMDLDEDLFYKDGIKNLGNVSGASCMFALNDSLTSDFIEDDRDVLLGAFGASLKVGAAHLKRVGQPKMIAHFRD